MRQKKGNSWRRFQEIHSKSAYNFFPSFKSLFSYNFITFEKFIISKIFIPVIRLPSNWNNRRLFSPTQNLLRKCDILNLNFPYKRWNELFIKLLHCLSHWIKLPKSRSNHDRFEIIIIPFIHFSVRKSLSKLGSLVDRFKFKHDFFSPLASLLTCFFLVDNPDFIFNLHIIAFLNQVEN